ncbi:MAG: LCP family protein [Acidimicrobiales bacterium]
MKDPAPRRDPRQLHVPAPGSESAPKPAARSTPAPSRRPDAPKSAGGSRTRSPKLRRPKLRRPKLRRPKLRRALLLASMVLPVALLLMSLGGWLYARSVYGSVEKIPLADVLTSTGSGTNYLIVGSDSRDPQSLIDAGLNPEAFEDGGGQRSDTMLLLRFVDGEALMLSIPRDLYVPIASTGGSAKINSAYGGGPRRLILTVEQSLRLPIHHYMEIDFVSFAGLVDALGGITIDFPNPAFDEHTGLNITRAGPNKIDGPTALAYVRSRHFVEVVDGRNQEDATGDLGRVQRQQRFLTAVFAEMGDTYNPFTLAGAASKASSGLRVDDTLGLLDAVRLAWRLRSLNPVTVVLPTRFERNEAGSVLFMSEPGADAALAQFR